MAISFCARLGALVGLMAKTGSFLPPGLFVISGLISFSAGTSWGTMAIMISISLPISIAVAEAGGDPARRPHVLAACDAVMGGAVFGDHASPISDTTILSAIGAGCPLLKHMTTQLPYALFVTFCADIGHLVTGLLSSMWADLASPSIVFVAGLARLPRLMPSGGGTTEFIFPPPHLEAAGRPVAPSLAGSGPAG
jgi:tetracycline resistance efflux pump